MKLKTLVASVVLCGLSQVASAKAPEQKLECADQAVRAAAVKNFKNTGASTSTCGAKLLTAGDFLETYLVCVSDETDPSEWVVSVLKAQANGKGEVTKTCVVKYAASQYDSQTPNFDDETGLLKTIGCSIDSDGSKDAEVVCK